jgi:FKBP-type peptidyl-prolyl cis-trans isomerase SlyD
MVIDKDTAVTVRFTLSDGAGKLIENRQEPTTYLHGGYGNMLPKLEEALQGQAAGFKGRIALSAADAFGERDESLLHSIPKSQFPPGVKVGGQLEGTDEQGQTIVFTVLKIKGDTVYLDGNHPLAGQDLRFDVEVLEVRAASAEEITHGHAHGAHGHHH